MKFSVDFLTKKILFVLLISLIYKNVASIFFGVLVAIFIGLLLFMLFILFIVKILQWIGSLKYIVDLKIVLLSLLIFGLIILLIRSLESNLAIVSSINILNSFRQIFIPLIIISLIIKNNHINFDFINRIMIFAIPVYVFAIIEIILPTSSVEFLFSSYNTANNISNSFEGGSYYFNDFGMHYKRLGSLFIDPLYFGIFTAYMFVTASLINKHKTLNIIIVLTGFFSLVKSFYTIFFISHFVKNKIIFNSIFIIVVVIFFYFIVILKSFSNEELKIIFFTLGNHINGIVSGIFNGFEYPFFGHGLGTTGYLNNSIDYRDINFYFKDIFDGTGSESAIGIMIYQLGYIFTFIFLWFKFLIIRDLYVLGYYKVASLFLGVIIVFILSESYYTVFLMIYPYVLYRACIINNQEFNIQKSWRGKEI